MLLILLQPDLGTAIVFVAITFGVLLLARVRVRYMVALALIGVLSIVGAYQLDILKEYQVARLTTFLNSEAVDRRVPATTSTRPRSRSAPASSPARGLFQGTQTSLSYVPENHTDFIFTVVGEELGFIGATMLLGLFGCCCGGRSGSPRCRVTPSGC
jgi:rod shape determining protein RodA